jgi:hypothetical protein
MNLTEARSIVEKYRGCGSPRQEAAVWLLQEVTRLSEGSIAPDYLFATDAEEIARELREQARRSAEDLRIWVDHVIEAMDKHKSGAFDRGWIDTLQRRVALVASDIDRANGAVLVRGTARE